MKSFDLVQNKISYDVVVIVRTELIRNLKDICLISSNIISNLEPVTMDLVGAKCDKVEIWVILCKKYGLTH
jgi:hypothetical protein